MLLALFHLLQCSQKKPLCSLHLCGRGPRAQVAELDLGSKLMVGLLESNGQAMLAQQIVAQHQQQAGAMDVDSDSDYIG